MEVTFIEENKKKKFAVIPFGDFVKIMEQLTEQHDYQTAIKILNDTHDQIVDYRTHINLDNPIALMRKKRKLTQADLAKKLKVDTSYISRIERPGVKHSDKLLARLALALNCAIDDLI